MKRPALMNRIVNSYYYPAFFAGFFAISISFITRLLLLLKSSSGVDWNVGNIIGLFGIGLLFDLIIASYFMIPLVLHLWWMNDRMYAKKARIWMILVFLIIVLVLVFSDLIPKDFNEDLRTGVIAYFVIRLLIYLGLTFAGSKFRDKWRKVILFFDLFLIMYILVFNAVSEWFFWDEFSARYNFIAVDYLVYTTEVIGNIRESYPIGWLLVGIFLVVLILLWLVRKPILEPIKQRPVFVRRSFYALLILMIPLAGFFWGNSKYRAFSKNEYVNELAGNGIFEFGTAFWHNELDFFKYYQTLPDREAFTILRKELSQPGSEFTDSNIFNIERRIRYKEPEKRMNVVMISVESLSADFMQAFGSDKGITPQLDSLSKEGLFFTNLYSSGTRTVRGLEALALSIPPTPGQSIVKRPENENLFSLGSVLKSKGYITQYIYGGYGYFDNMNYFFSNNGYTVIDRTALLPGQIHYANIWGVADEDLFSLALQTMDKNYKEGKPFFSQVMTVSNHRPFTYPDGRIDIPSSRQVREGAVKYTDYAIGKFLRDAKLKSWFSNTIFVVVADHCAGSAGSVKLPVTGYHIPMLIYSPGTIIPQNIDRLTAQIDIAPTILGLLKLDYTSKFIGQDIFTLPAGGERAFISTYQGLGYLKAGRLVIQSPVKMVEEFIPDFINGKAIKTAITDSLEKQAIAYYQCTSWLIKNKKFTR